MQTTTGQLPREFFTHMQPEASKKSVEDSQIVSLPAPPLSATASEDLVYPGETVIVGLLNGEKIIGTLQDFSPHHRNITITPEDSPQEQDISFDDLKIIHLPKTRRWMALESGSDQIDNALNTSHERQDFEIEFNDDDCLEGNTIGYRHDRQGFHIYPVQYADEYIHTYIPHSSIRKSRIGPLIGEVLVQENLVSQEQLDEVLDSQAQERSLPIGELLKSKAVVTAMELERALERQKSAPSLRLGEILVSEKLVTEDEIQAALDRQKQNRKKPLGEILVDMGLVSTEEIQRSLARKLCIPFVDLQQFEIELDDARLLPEKVARNNRVVPLYAYEGKLVVAMENPMNWKVIEELGFHVNHFIEPVMATVDDIDECLQTLYSTASLRDLNLADISVEDNAESDEDYNVSDDDVADNIVVKLVNKIIIDSYHKGASDIHIESGAGKSKTQVRIRKDGTLKPYYEVPPSLKNHLVARIKVMAGLDTSERRKPQDGKINFGKFSNLKIELRVATIPVANDLEDVVLRILASGKPVELEKLGLSEGNVSNIKSVLDMPYGLFFVCGPTGSGKTTSLHSALHYLNTDDRKIWTAEDPVEITQPGLRQLQVKPAIGLTFASAMRAFLRADPDIIMIGEMRDTETASTCIEASLTGHLVLSTLHTNSATESISRFIDMGMEPYNFADALLGILAQRLAKTLCPSCKESYTPDDDEVEEILLEYCQDLFVKDGRTNNGIKKRTLKHWKQTWGDGDKLSFHRAKGCNDCDHTGYAGRIALHELLIANDEIKHAIITNLPVNEIQKTALANGMRTLKMDGIEKMLSGATDMKQVRSVCIR